MKINLILTEFTFFDYFPLIIVSILSVISLTISILLFTIGKKKSWKKMLAINFLMISIYFFTVIIETIFITIFNFNYWVWIFVNVYEALIILLTFICFIILKIKSKNEKKEPEILEVVENKKDNNYKICEYCGCKVNVNETKCSSCNAVIK